MKLRVCLIVLVALLVPLLGLSGCDEKRVIDKVKDGAAELLLGTLEQTVSDPRLIQAYANDGWEGVEDVGLSIFVTNARNNVTELAYGNEAEQLLYDLIMEIDPVWGEIVAGVWARYEGWCMMEGYPGASLHLLLEITPEQRAFLRSRLPTVIVEEYTRVTGHPPELGGLEIGVSE